MGTHWISQGPTQITACGNSLHWRPINIIGREQVRSGTAARTQGALSSTQRKGVPKAVHSAAQVSLLFSNQRRYHFHPQHPWRLNNKCNCAHLCAHGSVGLKRRCGQTDCWRIAVLRHQNAITLLANKNHVYSPAALSCCFQGALSG